MSAKGQPISLRIFPATNIQNAAQGVRLLALAADARPARPHGEEQPAEHQQRDVPRCPGAEERNLEILQCRKALGRIDPPEVTSL